MEEYCTKTMVYFTLYGDYFPLEEFTKEIGINPTNAYKQGEEFIIGKHKLVRDETAWRLETDAILTDFPQEPINQIIDSLFDSAAIIKKYKERFNLKCHIMTVIYFNSYQTRGLVINHRLIEFAHKVGAEYQFDIYNNVIE